MRPHLALQRQQHLLHLMPTMPQQRQHKKKGGQKMKHGIHISPEEIKSTFTFMSWLAIAYFVFKRTYLEFPKMWIHTKAETTSDVFVLFLFFIIVLPVVVWLSLEIWKLIINQFTQIFFHHQSWIKEIEYDELTIPLNKEQDLFIQKKFTTKKEGITSINYPKTKQWVKELIQKEAKKRCGQQKR